MRNCLKYCVQKERYPEYARNYVHGMWDMWRRKCGVPLLNMAMFACQNFL
jgi:hypothetical protein